MIGNAQLWFENTADHPRSSKTGKLADFSQTELVRTRAIERVSRRS